MSVPLPAFDTADESASDRRSGGDRYVTIFRTGKLTRAASEELCVLRNISPGGAMIHHNGCYVVGEAVVLDLRRDEQLHGRVAWIGEGRCGIAFAAAVDLAHVLSEGQGAGPRPRPPRLKLATPVRLTTKAGHFAVILRDLSQTGACLQLSEDDVPQEPEFRLRLDELGDYRALVRWRRGGFLGVNFVSTLPIWPLNAWVRKRRGNQVG